MNNADYDINARLTQLEADYEQGKNALVDADGNRQTIAKSLMRLEGAITILREQGAKNAGEIAAAEMAKEFPDVIIPAGSVTREEST